LNQPLPIESEVADTVISLSVMEHLREPQLFLNEAHRILKRGGGDHSSGAIHVVGARGTA
jgi:ubiquinone/menaquinone biosynthesis C-methylase UbiE